MSHKMPTEGIPKPGSVLDSGYYLLRTHLTPDETAAGKFMGPFGTVVQLEYGYALRSDIPQVQGEQEVQLLFLKIF